MIRRGSALRMMTLVVPPAIIISASPPAPWVIGPTARCTGGTLVGQQVQKVPMTLSQTLSLCITAFGSPVVPPVAANMTIRSGLAGTSRAGVGRRDSSVLREMWTSEAASGSASRQTASRILSTLSSMAAACALMLE